MVAEFLVQVALVPVFMLVSKLPLRRFSFRWYFLGMCGLFADIAWASRGSWIGAAMFAAGVLAVVWASFLGREVGEG